MRPRAASRPERDPSLLVLGYEGTLQPDPACGAAADAFPLDLEHRVEPFLIAARRGLGLRIPPAQRICGGEPAPFSALEDSLRDRLHGILTIALGVHPQADEEHLARGFPALHPLLAGAVAEWVDAIATFHTRLNRDTARLAQWLNLPSLPALHALSATDSDSHAGGHKVIHLEFAGGLSLYYKPRPVTGEWLWHQLLLAVQAQSPLRLASAAVLAGENGRYGWMRAIPRRNDPHRPENHWQAAGAVLCLAEHMRITDLHMANLIATCHGPAPFDTESLATPRSASDDQKATGPAAAIADLLDTGLLPTVSADWPDVSGLFGKSAAVPNILLPRWSVEPGGTPRLEIVPAALVEHGNQHGNAPPSGSPVAVLPDLVSGYREAAHALMRCHETLLATGSSWRSVLETLHAPRIILCDTLSYGLLLSRSLQPQALRSVRHRFLLLRDALQEEASPQLPQSVLRTEQRTLLHLHIPRFTALPGTRTLATSAGRPLAARFLAATPAETVGAKLAALTPESLESIQTPALLLAILGRQS